MVFILFFSRSAFRGADPRRDRKWIKNGSQNDSIFDQISTLVSMKIYIDVLIDFLTLLGSILKAFSEQIRLRNHASEIRLGNHASNENERLACTRCSFSRIWVPKIHPKMHENSIEKLIDFLMGKKINKGSILS